MRHRLEDSGSAVLVSPPTSGSRISFTLASKPHVQCSESAQAEIVAPHQRGRFLQAQVRQPAQDRGQSNLALEAPQCCAKATMSRPPKGEVAVIFTVNVQAVRLW